MMPVALLLVSLLCGADEPGWLVRVDSAQALVRVPDRQALGGPFYRIRGVEPRELRRLPGVRWVVREQRRRILLDQITPDPSEPLQWHLYNDGSRATIWPRILAGVDIGAHPAWTVTSGAAATVVAVLDHGIPDDHPDLSAESRMPGWDFVDDDADPSPGVTTAQAAHGTQVAGLILAQRNGVGVVGVCPDCTLLPLRVLADDATARDGDLVAALMWSAARADVVNCSWSFDPNTYVSPAFHDAVRWAATEGRSGRGTVVVFSAGNRSERIPTFAPAAMVETLSVGATDETDTRAGYSNYGPALVLVAPGGVADEYADGVRTPRAKMVSADLVGEAGSNPTSDAYVAPGVSADLDVTASFYGTSASAPLVAGAAALLLSNTPELTATEVRWLLTETAAKVGADAYDSRGRNDHYGFGRLDVGAALALLQTGAYCRATPEVCDNAIDDDCDRLTDLEDPDCGAVVPATFALSLDERCDDQSECGDGYCGVLDGQDRLRFCTADCDYDCPLDGACVGPAGRGRCLQTCQQLADCPGGTRCALPAQGLVPPGQDRLPVCLALCGSDKDCDRAFCVDGVCAAASAPAELIELEPPTGCACRSGSTCLAVIAAVLMRWRQRQAAHRTNP
jgi:subtilisin family serine protease